MPLGFFGGGSSSSKPQPLSTAEDNKEKKERKECSDKEGKGTLLKLQKTTVTIERKLAEGGFAIVYLVSDKQNRQYALKRQFINDDIKQVEACKREYQIVSGLKGHKNIVCYVDHLLTQNKNGIYDYMLLTAYYKSSVLQLMNDRLAVGRCLSLNEILSIFCDMCSAVARLHHSQTPVIHRDLKVENILIDGRNRAAPPIYVLCDFGSATTKVLSTNTQQANFILEEVEKYTTLSYRAPEMIDIYQGKSIGTAVDLWALGVMLYKLCYFTLPFGESAMAIQNGAFSFPSQPSYPDSIKAIIKCLLEAEIEKRPNIFQCASLAHETAGTPCPILNKDNVPVLTLAMCSEKLHSRKPLTSEAPVEKKLEMHTVLQEKFEIATGSLCSTSPQRVDATTTSVNPRLRPKPTTSIPSVPLIPPSPKPSQKVHNISSAAPATPAEQPEPLPSNGAKAVDSTKASVNSIPNTVGFGFTEFSESAGSHCVSVESKHISENALVRSSGPEADGERSNISSSAITQSHRRNVSDTAPIAKSAFKPYSQLANQQVSSSVTCINNRSNQSFGESNSVWNPFMAAPFGEKKMDDQNFGKEFDVLPRNLDQGDIRKEDSDAASIDSLDPFGAAPFDPLPRADSQEGNTEVIGKEEVNDDKDSVGSAEDLKRRMQVEEDSELDEQRMNARRRYSYEHIDGVGEDGSSDSRGRTEGESTDDLSRNESSHDDDNDSSQQTDVVSDDGGGRPLLEDDGLEDDDDREEMYSGYNNHYGDQLRAQQFASAPPLTIEARRCTNPFLNSDLTPKISPVEAIEQKFENLQCGADFGNFEPAPIASETERKSFVEKASLPMVTPLSSAFAPATLPRQATPLSAVPRTTVKAIIDPAPVAQNDIKCRTQQVHAIVTMNSEVATSNPSLPEKEPITNVSCKYSTFLDGHKTPKFKKGKVKGKSFNLDSTDSDLETDGSEAEMCTSTSSDKIGASKKKKKGSAFALLSSGSSALSQEKSSSISALSKKEKRKTSSGKRGSAGAINASFVNTSFQAEDPDSPPIYRSNKF